MTDKNNKVKEFDFATFTRNYINSHAKTARITGQSNALEQARKLYGKQDKK